MARRSAFVVVVLVAVAALAWWKWGGRTGSGRERWGNGERVQVRRKTLERTIEAVGAVEPAFVLDVKSKASGEIVSMPYEEGQSVAAGVLLVELLPIDEERNVRTQRARVTSAEAELSKAQGALRQAEIKLEVARRGSGTQLDKARVENEVANAELKRQQTLNAQKLASQKEVDDARKAAQAAETALELARGDQRSLELMSLEVTSKRDDVKLQDAALEREKIALEVAELRLKETRILAPMPGLVLKRNVERGQIIASGISNVSGGTTLMTLADVSRLYLVADVDESDIGGVQPGMEADLSAEAFPDKKLTGKVDRIAPQGEVVQNVTVFKVRIELGPEAVKVLKPGMNATAKVVLERHADALVVPSEAVRRRGDSIGVLVAAEEGRPHLAEVKLGLRSGKEVEILGEVSEKDSVILPSTDAAAASGAGGGQGGGPGGMRGVRAFQRGGGS